MSSPETFRARFPVFDNKVFLNSCSKGALSDSVEAGYNAYLDSWRIEGSSWDEWVAMLEKSRSAFANYVGCSDDEVAVTYSVSTAIASLFSALSFEGKRNRIAIGDFEFPTMAHNLLTQERRGASIVRVRTEDHRLPIEAYTKALDERVLLVPTAHVCFRNGYRQDVEGVVNAARSVGAYSLVDDYQCSGTRPIDVRALGCDFFVTGMLKYMLGSSGLGFMYVRRELIKQLEPVMTGWFAQENPFDFDIERVAYHASARRFETGTPPVPNLYGGHAALELTLELDPKRVQAHIDSLTARLMGEARERRWQVLTPEEPERRGPLVVLGCTDANRAVELLGERDVVVSARGSGLRVSFHYYNTSEDIDALLTVLDAHPELMASTD